MGYYRTVEANVEATMDRTPAPISLATARGLPWKPGRSAEAFIDGDLEIRFTPRPTDGPQKPHQRDEVYIVAAGSGFYRVDGTLTAVGPGDIALPPPTPSTASRSSPRISPSGSSSTVR
jgi:mannose-6-phosphate isomerase-like protein (cupin superfamily)